MADANVENVVRQLRQRSEVGYKKYGCTTEREDLSPLDWLQHAQEESLDFAVYLEVLKTKQLKFDCAKAAIEEMLDEDNYGYTDEWNSGWTMALMTVYGFFKADTSTNRLSKECSSSSGCGNLDDQQGQPLHLGECSCDNWHKGTGKFDASISDFEYACAHQSCLDPAIARAAGLSPVRDSV